MYKLDCWLQDSLRRAYPASVRPGERLPRLEAARGERLSLQVCLRLYGSEQPLEVKVTAKCPVGIGARVRRVGYVPLRHLATNTPLDEIEGAEHLPGLCPDPLFDENEYNLPPHETTAFWITLEVSPNCIAGNKRVTLEVAPAGGRRQRLSAEMKVHPVRAERLSGFPVTHWFYADVLLLRYGLKPWESRFWEILPAYFENLVEHCQDTVYVPVFTPPLDGVKIPSQLLGVSRKGDKYVFDWKHVRRWVRLARRAGIRNFEWCHPFTQWGVRHALRVYAGKNGDGELLWSPQTSATGKTYRNFLAQFLPELKKFIEREGIAKRSFFHVSDEPHGEEHRKNYLKARNLLRELAPWMRVMDALSEIEYGRGGLTDMPVPSIRKALEFRAEKIPCWCYFCCGPRGKFLNRLLDTPLAKLRMAGWLFHRFEMKGFLHWGYNFWLKRNSNELVDPFGETGACAWPEWPAGDPFVVYPGPEGPLDSIRWEIWAESLRDLALLRGAGVAADSPLLAKLRSFEDFPKDARWLRAARAKILRLASRRHD